jgi:hypothetical protein
VETIRTGGAIDPASIASADTAAMIRSSPLIVTTGRKCAFALATFEQWFAAQAILDNIIGMDEVLATMDTFNRWRYVLAIIAATTDPARADTMLAALASWNPGAASWGIDETRAGGLTRTSPDIGPGDWEAVGGRIRTAMQAWPGRPGPTRPVLLGYPFLRGRLRRCRCRGRHRRPRNDRMVASTLSDPRAALGAGRRGQRVARR